MQSNFDLISVILLCTEITSDRRRILIKAQLKGMTDGSFVYLLPDHLPSADITTPWIKSDEFDPLAKLAFKSAFQVRVIVLHSITIYNHEVNYFQFKYIQMFTVRKEFCINIVQRK